jgi:hypothetical protein
MKRLLVMLAACGNPSPAMPPGIDASSSTDSGLIDSGLGGPVDGDLITNAEGFDLRISETTIGANGHTRREVLVTGFSPDGSPRTDDMIVTLDRASAGTLGADHLTLSPLGARTSFTPCDGATAGCLGPAHLAIARASAPTTLLARIDLALVAPVDVSSVAPCAGGGNVFHLDGADSLFYDMHRVDDAVWIIDGSVNLLNAYGSPADPTEGTQFVFSFETAYSDPVPFTVGTFTNLSSPSSQTTGPSMEPGLNGAGCSQFTGAYQVHDVTLDGTQRVTAMTLSFEKICPTVPHRILEGCIRFGH